MMRAENITYSVGSRKIVANCSVTISPGTFTAVVGPNGAGKTSLLKVLAREVSKFEGAVFLNEQKLSTITIAALSRLRAVLSQHTSVNFPFTVEQVIAIGRYTHKTTRDENDKIISDVMERTGLGKLTGRSYQTLSGGEQQRVQMARVMAQLWDASKTPKYLLLDEPTSSLDLAHQHALLSLAKEICTERGIGVLAILHDLNLAAQYADDILFLKNGRTVAYGAAQEVLTAAIIYETFSYPVEVSVDSLTNIVRVYPLPSSHPAFHHYELNQYTYEHSNN